MPLKQRGVRYVRLDGSTSQASRSAALADFSGESGKAQGPQIFLLSLKAGGVGLNLCAASTVFLMDPWWNPAVEEQAMDRCHRIGQTKEVVVRRFGNQHRRMHASADPCARPLCARPLARVKPSLRAMVGLQWWWTR